MLEVKPIKDKNEQKSICEACGMEYDPLLFAYKAYDGGKLFACVQFDILGSGSVIKEMKQVPGTEIDYESLFITGRAVMNFLDLCGVAECEYNVTDGSSEKLAKLLGFKKDGEKYTVSLSGMFNSPCQHGNGYDPDK